MISRIKAAILTSCIIASLSSAAPNLFAAPGDYKSITIRNPFGLAPLVAPIKAPPPIQLTPPVQIELTGLSTLSAPGRAFFKLTYPDRKKPEYCQLRSGESKGGLKVLAIDIKQAMAVIEFNSATRRLKLEKKQLKSAALALPKTLPHR